jgi:hypothetical protein
MRSMAAARHPRGPRGAIRREAPRGGLIASDGHEAFYRRAYSEDQTPSLLLRRFARAYVNGEFVPVAPGESKPLKGPVNFALSRFA